MTVLRFFGIITVLPLVNLLIAFLLSSTVASAVILAVLLATWAGVHRSRQATWGDLPLVYEDEPEPVVRSLNLGKR